MKLQTRESTFVRCLQLQTLLGALAAAALGLSSCGGGGGAAAGSPPAEVVDPLLADLGLPPGFELLVPFDPSAPEIAVRCRFPQDRLRLAPVALLAGAQIVVDGELLAPGRASRGSQLREGETPVAVRVEAAGGLGVREYRVLVQREFATEFAQNAFIKASTPGQNDSFAAALAVDGERLVVGTPFEDSAATGIDGDETDNSLISSGAAYVFVRNGASWRQEAYLKAPVPGADDQFGSSVDISGDLLVVGAPGEDSAATGVGGNQQNEAAPASGAAYVYRRTAGTWRFDAYLKPSNTVVGAVGAFGTAVAIDGTTIAVGAPREDGVGTGVNDAQTANGTQGADSGAVYVYVAAGASWAQQAYVKGFVLGPTDGFGGALDLDGDMLAVGARSEDGRGTGTSGDPLDNGVQESGAVFTYVRNGLVWNKDAYIKASNTGLGDQFGSRVALSGNLLAVAARNERSLAAGVDGNQFDDSGLRVGAVYVFAREAGAWTQDAYIKASNPSQDDAFGEGLALRGEILLVGAQAEDSPAAGLDAGQGDGGFNVGAAYLYTRTAGVWSQRRYMKASNARNSGFYGSAVGIAPFGIVVGGSGDNSGSSGVDGSQASIGNFAGHGAVYTYE